MKREVAEALEGSIKHWDENAAAQEPGDASVYAKDCHLCAIFNTQRMWRSNVECRGCPVMKRTGDAFCVGSPWSEASLAWTEWRHNGGIKNGERFRENAVKERDFLISLREPIDDEESDAIGLPARTTADLDDLA
jgi:hypothetical protein